MPNPLPTPERLSQLWRCDGYGQLLSQQPLVAAGDRLLGVAGNTLFAVDIFRGKEPEPDAQVAEQGFPCTLKEEFGGDPYVTAAGGVVYFMDGEKMRALRVSDGQPLRIRDDKGAWVDWAPPKKLQQVTGLHAVGDKVIAIHIGDLGQAEATGIIAATGAPTFGPIVIDELSPGRVSYGDGAVLFIADGLLHAVNADFGDDRYKPTNGGRAAEPLNADVAPCVGGDAVAAAGGLLHLFDVRTGIEKCEPIAPVASPAAWATPVAAEKGQLIIATNTHEVVAVRSADGRVAWRTRLVDPGAPSLIPGHVLVTTDTRRMLATLSLKTGEVVRRMILPEVADGLPLVVTNETVFIPDAAGSIQARSFARQHAALFDGKTARIDIKAQEKQFDFGTEDFTIEAWIRSCEGGEIVSSYPAVPQSGSHGFRLNLGENGELCVAVVDAQASRMHAGRTRPTHANDGEWHHIALIRRDHVLLALLDGKSLDVFFRDDSKTGLSIGGNSGLTIGAYKSSADAEAQHHFQGLIREVRIWDRALDVATVQNNRHVQLTGNEPRLKGLWTLAEVQQPGVKNDPVNAVVRHQAQATFVQAASTPADLALDRSGFPYLLHEAREQWPYAGAWAARGEKPITSRAAMTGNALAFSTNNALYAVRRTDGRRLWQIDMPTPSAPIADGARFLALTDDDGVIAIDAMSGEFARVDAFAGLMRTRGGALAAPAVTATHMAAGAAGTVRVVDRRTTPVGVRDVAVPAPVRELAFGEAHLYALCGEAAVLQLACIDVASGNKSLVPVAGTAFVVDREWLFCVRDGKVTRLAGGGAGQALQSASAIAGAITGLAARRDLDLLVVSTDAGDVHGLSMADLSRRWSVTLPEGRAKGGAARRVNPPVFDAAGRICCTTGSGTVAMLDSRTGARIGLYFESQPATTPPTMSSATAYYGCAETTDAKADRDGALHSVVFGETMVLRLGLDERGSPSAATPYAKVSIETVDVDRHTLHLMDPARSCIEAWVNVPAPIPGATRTRGGGVLGICPTAAGGFDVNLAIAGDGTLRYSARSLTDGIWKTLQVEASTPVGDGAWHHIAVSRDGDDHAVVYVDGQALTTARTSIATSPAPRTVTGIRAYLGATAGANLEATTPFCGMIADVRVWDTFLEPAEISARMHVKLRGSEPDLIAFWNFDRQNVEDAGPEHHHGTLVDATDQNVWWLSDLAFEKPSYPYVTTTARAVRQMADQAPTYEVAFTVRRADGTGIPGHQIALWYIKHRPDDPADIMVGVDPITGVTAAAAPEPGTPSPDGKQRVFSATTGADGTATVLVTPSRVNHTPALDLRAEFMPRNERYHVNILINEQLLMPVTPPSLVAQSKLVQDYAYSSGGTINEGRDRSTWRTVIRAVNPDGSLRVGEPLSIWAAKQLTVEVAGRSYAINTENSAEVVTDGQGEVAVVTSASDLTATSLMVRAGFMHRNDRIVVTPDQDLHRQLTSVKGSDFTAKRTTRWKPGMKEGEGEALLTGDYAEHADKVADAISTVMAAAKPAGDQPAPPRGQAGLLRAQARKARPRLRAGANDVVVDPEPMRQPDPIPGADRVVTFRTMSHAPRAMPLDPAGMRAALDRNAGFVFETLPAKQGQQRTLRFELLDTAEKVKAERGKATPTPVLVQGIFGDIWSGIKDVATTVYDGAVKVVVSIADTIQVAIHKLVDGVLKIVHVVVNSIVEAVNAVANFFEQLGVMIMKVIEFLRALFNWKAILRTKEIISDLFVMSIDSAKAAMKPARLEAALLALTKAGDQRPAPGGQSLNARTAAAGDANSPAIDEARGVQGQMVMQKSRENPISAKAGDTPPRPAASADPFDELTRGIPSLISGLLDRSPAEMVDKLLALLRDGMDAGIRLMVKSLASASAVAIEIVDWAMKLLRTEIRIPFLSELYKWITGKPLTLLDLVCLALAVPVHLAHIAVTTIMGQTRTFADDNAGLIARMRAKEQEMLAPPRALKANPVDLVADTIADAPKVPMPRPSRMDTSSETLVIVLRAINIGAGLMSDAMFTKTVSSGGIGAASLTEARVRGLFKVIKGATGIAAAYFQTYESTPKSDARIQSGLTPEVWEAIKPAPWMPHTIFAVQVAGDLITFGGGLKQVISPSMPQGIEMGPIEGDDIDKVECFVAKCAIPGCIGLITYRSILLDKSLGKLREAGADPNIINQVLMYGIRDISMIVARMPWFMFTQTGANSIRKIAGGGATTVYGIVTGARALAQGAALGTHVLAAYHFGQRP